MNDDPGPAPSRPADEPLDFRLLLDKLVDVVIVHEAGRLVYVNQAGADLVGAPSPAPLIGRSMMDFVAPESTSSVVARARALTLTGGVRSGNERTFLRLDGSRVKVETTGIALDARRTLVVIRDLSRETRVERAHRSAESQLAAFIEVTTDGVAIARSSDGRHVMANAAHARMFGFERPEDEVGTTPLELIAPSERPRVAEISRQLGSREIRSAELLTRGLRRDGTEFDLEVRVVAFEDLDELLIAATMRDVTERRRAEEERARLQERLRHSEKLEAIGRLAGGIAHDFNNILSGILGYAELTQLALDRGGELYDHQQRIREATLRARALVRQILTFSRRDQVQRHVIDVPAVVTEALGLVRAGVSASIALDARIDPSAGSAEIDPTQLHQVVLNLCSNARDAIGARGRIDVEVAAVLLDEADADLAPGRWVRLRVRDDGTGMDEETRARIFEPYMTTKGPFGGHGLGLAVVHGIVTGAGGVVRVDTAPGRGATFDVYLPWRPLPAGEDAPSARVPPGRGVRILLADDEPLVRSAHRRLLESLGYAVDVAADGEEALARFREAPGSWGLVLTDLSMPRLDGMELARALLSIRPDLPIVLFTGYGEALDGTTARRAGVHTVIQKPVDRATLAGILETALSGR